MVERNENQVAEPERPFVSYAQNGEDVVLWRALGDVSDGFYVDVGAADPIEYSVTRGLYEHGWRGIDVEPLPGFAAALVEDRPRDTVVASAAGSTDGEITFHEVVGTGLSTIGKDEAQAARERGFEVVDVTIPMRRLDSILEEHLPAGGTIHVLKIDVEGAEAEVLAGVDLRRWRPWVVVVEATRPLSTESTRDSFEELVTGCGYTPTLFDGLNVFYVSDEHPELTERLSYPACPLDLYTSIETMRLTEAGQRFAIAEAAAFVEGMRRAEADEKAKSARARANQATKRVEQMENSAWWRATNPGRSTVHKLKGRGVPLKPPVPALPSASMETKGRLAALDRRLRSVLQAFDYTVNEADGLPRILELTVQLLQGATDKAQALWLLHIAFTTRYPDDGQIQQHVANLELDGAAVLIDEFRRASLNRPATWATLADLEIVTVPFIDVTHTATYPLHTGIQRVVRETVPRWVEQHDARLAVFDNDARCWRPPSESESELVLNWGHHTLGQPIEPPTKILAPLNTTILLPELGGEVSRCERLLAAAQWSGSKLSAIVFDLIPFTLPEACAPGMTSAFAQYMSVIRSASRVSTISATVADDLEGLRVSFRNQAIDGPQVQPHLLPIQAVPISDGGVERLASAVRSIPGLPLVLSVSSIEPRKNQTRILLAAERLWREGHSFQLAFIAGSGWKRNVFDAEFERAQGRGRPVRVISEASEEVLAAAYRTARFTVFVSITEGFGLPAAESIAAGTPVVLSSHGSMREIGEGGGAEFVDAYDVDDITSAMRLLLTDDSHLELLRKQALDRIPTTWDEYADQTWDWLAGS